MGVGVGACVHACVMHACMCACVCNACVHVCMRGCVCVSVCLCGCGCVWVRTSIHREGFICLDQVGYQGADQRCYVEDVNFLYQVSSSYFRMEDLTFLTSHFILFAQ